MKEDEQAETMAYSLLKHIVLKAKTTDKTLQTFSEEKTLKVAFKYIRNKHKINYNKTAYKAHRLKASIKANVQDVPNPQTGTG